MVSLKCTEPFQVRNKANMLTKIRILESNLGRDNLRTEQLHLLKYPTKDRLEEQLKALKGLVK